MRVGVDVGGTFTDLVALGQDGALRVRKVLSTPQDPAIGLFRAVDELQGLGARASGVGEGGPSPEPRSPSPVAVLVHGTTVATNALLERTGARVVLVTTAGFEDLLWLRRQDRAALYDLAREHAAPLVPRDRVVGVRERMGPEGEIRKLTEVEVRRVVRAVRALAPEAVAVSFLFGFLHPSHEARLTRALRGALPGVPVAAGSEVLPVFREYERTSTTTAEAYLRPRVSCYVARAAEDARARGVGSFRIMTSSGGSLAPEAAAERSAALALSGPAGGVVGARLLGDAVGMPDLLTLDMGGTSADASLVTGGAALSEESGVLAGIPLALPAILIETVSAGGGSIASVDEGGALKVGPASAGAVPGPACYGRGGTRPTVTDACVILGWLDPGQLLADGVRLDNAAAERAVATLAEPLARDTRAVAVGIVEVATAVMARALKRVSVARGVDPRRMALVPFGGAGPLFGCALAEALGIETVVVPPHPGVLSALGLATAPERVDIVTPFHRPLGALAADDLDTAYRPLTARATEALPGAVACRWADCRFAGQGYEITVDARDASPDGLRRAFLAAHRARHGYADASLPVEVVNLRVAALRAAPGRVRLGARAGVGRPTPMRRRIALRGRSGREEPAEIWSLGELPEGLDIRGPAVLAGPDATGLVEPGWLGRVHESGAVILKRIGA